MSEQATSGRRSVKTERMVARAAWAAMQGLATDIHVGSIAAAKDIARRLSRYEAGDAVRVLLPTKAGVFELYRSDAGK